MPRMTKSSMSNPNKNMLAAATNAYVVHRLAQRLLLAVLLCSNSLIFFTAHATDTVKINFLCVSVLITSFRTLFCVLI